MLASHSPHQLLPAPAIRNAPPMTPPAPAPNNISADGNPCSSLTDAPHRQRIPGPRRARGVSVARRTRGRGWGRREEAARSSRGTGTAREPRGLPSPPDGNAARRLVRHPLAANKDSRGMHPAPARPGWRSIVCTEQRKLLGATPAHFQGSSLRPHHPINHCGGKGPAPRFPVTRPQLLRYCISSRGKGSGHILGLPGEPRSSPQHRHRSPGLYPALSREQGVAQGRRVTAPSLCHQKPCSHHTESTHIPL